MKRAPHPESPALVELPEVVVTSESVSLSNPGPPPLQEKFQLPQTAESITAERIRETVNIVDPEDAVKYLPSLFVRKRNNGDTQATLATRTAGVNASARSLVYADDLLLSALIANNNTLGAPRWGLVSPEEIERVDFLYGPFAAAFPGNSAGGVLQITTRMPEKLVALVDQTEAYQTFHRYGTQDTYLTNQTNVVLGNKTGPVSWLFTGNYQESSSQPLAFVTNGTIPANTTGTFPALNKLGAPADVVGAGGLLHSSMFNAKGKIAWEVTPWLQAAYQVGVWSGDTESHVQTYLRDASGERTYAGLGGFANNDYTVYQTHLSNALSLKTDTKSAFDWDFSVSDYYYLEDIQRNPYGALPTGEAFTSQGKITRAGWHELDQWRLQGNLASRRRGRPAAGDFRSPWRPLLFEQSCLCDGYLDRRAGRQCPALHGQPGGDDDGSAMAAGCLALYAPIESHRRRAAGVLAGVAGIQSGNDGEQCRHHHRHDETKAAGPECHALLAEGIAHLDAGSGMGNHRFLRPGLSLSDRHGTVPDRLDGIDLRHPESEPETGKRPERRACHSKKVFRWDHPLLDLQRKRPGRAGFADRIFGREPDADDVCDPT
ncbi:MAG: TonB-dependent receptor [Chthoniobacter sp.]